MEEASSQEHVVIPETSRPLGHVIYDTTTSQLTWDGPEPSDAGNTTFILAVSREMPVRTITMGPSGFRDDPVSARWLLDPALDPIMQLLFEPEPDKKVYLMVFPKNSSPK